MFSVARHSVPLTSKRCRDSQHAVVRRATSCVVILDTECRTTLVHRIVNIQMLSRTELIGIFYLDYQSDWPKNASNPFQLGLRHCDAK